MRRQLVTCFVGVMVASLLVLLGWWLGVQSMKPVASESLSQLPTTTEPAVDLEIERKWLAALDDLPFNPVTVAEEMWHIEQSYLSLSPEIRVRRITGQAGNVFYVMGVKSDTSVDGMTRREQEWYITESEYQFLLAKKIANTIEKTRYSIDFEGQNYQLDIFAGDLAGLVYVEVEFSDAATATAFNAPSFIGRDVTSDSRYKNQSLAQFGIPVD